MGGFSIPGIMPGRVLQGAVSRYRQIQDEEWKREETKRNSYVQQLGQLLQYAATGEDIAEINEEIARVTELPKEKRFTGRLLKLPSTKGASTGAGAGGTTGQSTPPFDFREVMETITGVPAKGAAAQRGAQGMQSPQSSQSPQGAAVTPGAPPQGSPQGQPPIVPQMGASGGGMPQMGPFTGATPQLVPPGGMNLPQVAATPLGRSMPEASPLVGTLPGQPTPSQPLAAATPQMGIQPQVAPAAPAAAPPITPGPQFMGLMERSELPYQLNQKYGMSKSGRSLITGTTPPSARDIASAADRGYKYTRGDDGTYSVEPIEDPEQLSLLRRSQLETDAARRKSMSVRDRLAEERPDLMRSLTSMRASIQSDRDTLRRRDKRLAATLSVAGKYEKSVKVFRDMSRSLSQLEAMVSQATGPGDYGSILLFVHGLDDTAAREGEVAMARSAASLADRLGQTIERWKSGELLLPEVREQFLSAARASNDEFQTHRAEIDEQYDMIAKEYDLDSRMVGLPTGYDSGYTPPSSAASTPSVTPTTAITTQRSTSTTQSKREKWERGPDGKLRRVQ